MIKTPNRIWPLVQANLQFARSEYKNLKFGNNK